MSNQVKIHGLEELKRELEKLPPKIQKKVVKAALSAGGDILKQRMKDWAIFSGPYTRGTIKRNIIKYWTKRAKKGRMRLLVGPSKKAAHGILQEFGTRFHGAQPFARHAWETGKGAANREIETTAKKKFEPAVKSII